MTDIKMPKIKGRSVQAEKAALALKKELEVQGTYRVNKHLKAQFLSYAKMNGTSGNALIEKMMLEYVDENHAGVKHKNEVAKKAVKHL